MLRSTRLLPIFRNASLCGQQRQLSFDLNEQQQQFREAALKFAKEVIAPVAAEYDRSGEFPWPIVEKAHENGFMNPSIPTQYGKLIKNIEKTALRRNRMQ
jgi:acyl-CoA dehydrogenase